VNADELLRHYERIADAPEAVAQLRRFVLDLAVRGKLVAQDPKEAPAYELLRDLAAQKSKQIGIGRATRHLESPKVADDELPFTAPRHWAWLRLRDIGRLSGGMTPAMSRSDYWGGDVVWISPKDVKSDELSNSELKITLKGLSETRLEAYPPGSLFMVARSGILKRAFPVAINRVPAAANQDMKVLVPFDQRMERYLQIMLRGLTEFVLKTLVKTGTTVQSLKYAEFETQPFPLPPLAEQHRIVAKVDELMALCDRLEAARAQREAARDRLARSCLARLDTPDPETFREDARFVLDALPALTARPDQIKSLRQTILNLAVRGTLVPQDPIDEPAPRLLRQLAARRAVLISSGKVAPQRPAVRDASRLTANAPSSWEAIALGDVCALVTSGSRGWADYYAESGAGFIRAQNIRFGTLRLDDLAFVNPPSKSEGSRTQVAKGDLLLVITGAGVTNPAMLDRDLNEAYVSQHVALVRPIDIQLSNWLLLCLMAPAGGRDELVERAYGSGKPGLNLDNIRSLSVPLPPLAEQHRIVAKVDELMALCDALKARLAEAQTTQIRLADAVVERAVA
jgi:type I restriction enzyme S subunit